MQPHFNITTGLSNPHSMFHGWVKRRFDKIVGYVKTILPDGWKYFLSLFSYSSSSKPFLISVNSQWCFGAKIVDNGILVNPCVTMMKLSKILKFPFFASCFYDCLNPNDCSIPIVSKLPSQWYPYKF